MSTNCRTRTAGSLGESLEFVCLYAYISEIDIVSTKSVIEGFRLKVVRWN